MIIWVEGMSSGRDARVWRVSDWLGIFEFVRD